MEFTKMGKNTQKKMAVDEMISATIVIAIAWIIRYAVLSFNLPERFQHIVSILFVVLTFAMLASILLSPTLGYHHRAYRADDRSVEYIEGIFFVNHHIIPVRRMQQVDIQKGPISKFFGTATVTVTTAGGTLQIEDINIQDAEELSERLKSMINLFAQEER